MLLAGFTLQSLWTISSCSIFLVADTFFSDGTPLLWGFSVAIGVCSGDLG